MSAFARVSRRGERGWSPSLSLFLWSLPCALREKALMWYSHFSSARWNSPFWDRIPSLRRGTTAWHLVCRENINQRLLIEYLDSSGCNSFYHCSSSYSHLRGENCVPGEWTLAIYVINTFWLGFNKYLYKYSEKMGLFR